MPRSTPNTTPLPLFAPQHAARWPDAARYPHNEAGEQVESAVRAVLEGAREGLVATGFTSVEYLVDVLGRAAPLGEGPVRVLLGTEPAYGGGAVARRGTVRAAARAYWLEQGISILHCGALAALVERIESGQVVVRTLERLHAKLYASERGAVVGSSNFSYSGLRRQHEANVAFAAGTDGHAAARQMGEALWEEGIDGSAWLAALLRELLKAVTWQEALARASAELLGGRWMDEYASLLRARDGQARLWPSQRAALAQALYVLDTRGSVLVADPTGSGKTRLGVYLLFALVNRRWARGEGHRTGALVVCPPLVEDAWKREESQSGARLFDTRSHGALSRQQPGSTAATDLTRAPLLFVDEAHNFLSRLSKRSGALVGAGADHVALFTATPINRGATDLLRIVELLGLDNLTDDEFGTYQALRRSRYAMTPAEQDTLRAFARRFTVRRTKRELNAFVDEDPAAYTDRHGRRCRYPRHESHVYPTGDAPADLALADAIRSMAQRLRGLLYLRRLYLPAHLDALGMRPDDYVRSRLHAAAALARYQVAAAMRSSPAALVEHTRGTAHAARLYGIEVPGKEATGDVVGRLAAFRFEDVQTDVPGEMLPDVLRDRDAFEAALHEERDLYTALSRLARGFTDARQRTRVALLGTLRARHERVLAFDRSLLTLAQLEQMARADGLDVLLVTGAHGARKASVQESFGLDGEASGVALLSDVMSEGVNLQGASAVVFLDAPTVIRQAEQRVGRVDRMDSPHAAIEVWWPRDPPPFVLRSSRRFVERFRAVERILGSNFTLPAELVEAGRGGDVDEEELDATTMVRLYERRQDEDAPDALDDAFAPVRGLVEGDDALVDRAVYAAMRKETSRVLARVSVVQSARPWAFVALRGTPDEAPRWLFVEPDAPLRLDLEEVSAALRARLAGAEDAAPDARAGRVLEGLLGEVRGRRHELLPPRQQQALALLERWGKRYARDAAAPARREVRRLLAALAGRADEQVDLRHLADAWLDVLAPRLRAEGARRRRALRVRDLERTLRDAPPAPEVLGALAGGLVEEMPLYRRVAACIVGVPETQRS